MRHLTQVTREFVAILLLTLTLGVPSGAQEPDQQDPHSLAYCVNHAGSPDMPMVERHICMATCDKNCEDGRPESSKCLTYCRPDHCHCLAECDN